MQEGKEGGVCDKETDPWRGHWLYQAFQDKIKAFVYRKFTSMNTFWQEQYVIQSEEDRVADIDLQTCM